MDTFLIALTAFSVAGCAACGFLLWRLTMLDKQRSGARVAALAAAIHADDRPAATIDPRAVAVSSMFTTTPGGSVSGRPLLKAAVVSALGLTLVVIAAMSTRDHTSVSAPPSSPAPLELLTMTHSRQGSKLTVTGTVRNPKDGAPLARIDAVVSAFDRSGAVATSGSAPLDFTTLQPGNESKFVVTVSGAGSVSRYRVSFRTGTSVVRHVDRRPQAQLAVAR